jgi:hypothetical protein
MPFYATNKIISVRKIHLTIHAPTCTVAKVFKIGNQNNLIRIYYFSFSFYWSPISFFSNKIGSFIDRDGKIYEGNIIDKERNWRPIKGEGKVIYPNQIILIANFENFCDGTSWGVDGKVYFPNGDYFVGCIKWHDLIPMTGPLYQGDQEFTYINGKKIPR